jgi:hypothetical protein
MGDYLKTTIIQYDKKTSDSYSVSDYLSKDIPEIMTFINSLDASYFSWYEVKNNDKLERIAYELYGNPDYWDILLLINNKRPLQDMPYDFDAINATAELMVEEYEANVYKSDIPESTRSLLFKTFRNKLEIEYESFRIMRIVNPSKINSFLQAGFAGGYF